MSSWNLRQRAAQLGTEEKVWPLSEGRRLTVGRSETCDIVLQSQTVEAKHAIFEWNLKNICFIVKDLGSVSGTYINNRPLRGNHALLEHNDAIRFGYDKDYVFRLEESFTSKTDSSLSPSHVTSISPTIPTPSTITSSPTTITTAQSTDVRLINQNILHHPHPVPQAAGGIQYVALPSSSPVAPQHSLSGGFIPVMTQGGHLAYSYTQPSLSPMVAGLPFYQPPQQIPPHLQIVTPPSGNSNPSPSDSAIQKSSPIPHLDGSEAPNRSDGRRSAHLEQSPALNKGSKLYGQPSWWGDEGNKEGGAESASSEFRFQKPGSQILRELDHPEGKSPSKLSNKDELRMSTISNQRHQDSTWVVDSSQPPSRLFRRSHDLDVRPRSADPSPNRLSVRRHEPSPSPSSPKRAVTPVTMKRSSSISTPRGNQQPAMVAKGRRQQRAATPPVTSHHTAMVPVSKNPPHSGDKGSISRKRPGSCSDTRSSTPKAENRHTRSSTPKAENRHTRSSTPKAEDRHTRSSTPKAEDRHTRSSTPKAEDRHTRSSTPKAEDRHTRSSTPKAEDRHTRSSTPKAEDRHTRSSTPKAEDRHTRSGTPKAKDRHTRSNSLHLHSRSDHRQSEPHAFLKSRSRKSGSVSNSQSPDHNRTSTSSSTTTPTQPQSGSSPSSSVPIQPHSGSNLSSGTPTQPHSGSKKEVESDDQVMGDETVFITSSDESNSSLSDHTPSSLSERVPVVVASNQNQSNGNASGNEKQEEVEEERGRKQWPSDETPDSLMLASIEARMRRLGKLAHQTARQVTALKTSVEDGHQMVARETDYLAMRSSSPVMTKTEQSLPEWKFFNKESNSIFRNIRVVERWLQDINANLNCIVPSDGEEAVDFASDGELYIDSIDTVGSSGSEEN